MPPVSPRKMIKKTKKPQKTPFRSMKKAAEEVIELITSDKDQDWTIGEIAEEAKKRAMVPSRVWEDAQMRAIVSWLSEGGRAVKKNVGTKEHPKMVRRFGVYIVFEQTEDGREVKRPCWREWEQMDRDQMKSSVRALFDIARFQRKEAKVHLDYCNRLLENVGRRQIELDEVK